MVVGGLEVVGDFKDVNKGEAQNMFYLFFF